MINIFINVIIPVIIIFLLGYLLGRFFKLDQKSFSTVSIYIFTPCLVFISLIEANGLFELATLKVFLATFVLLVITWILVEIASRILKLNKKIKTILLLTLILPNTGNYGMSVIEYAYGKNALSFASILLIIYIFYTNTVGVYVASRDNYDYKMAFKNILKVPVFYAMLVAILISFFKINLPPPIIMPVRAIGYSAIPVNLLLVGINLARVKLDKNILFVLGVSSVKLIIIPLIGYLLLKLFGIGDILFKVSLLQIAMPSAVYSSILATHFGANEKLASEIVLVSLILSMISLTAIIYFLG
ncbi:MAG: AEC family transporter [Brevinematales bacterium]|nr:AEC family transporter [Brevinematales bacterium]